MRSSNTGRRTFLKAIGATIVVGATVTLLPKIVEASRSSTVTAIPLEAELFLLGTGKDDLEPGLYDEILKFMHSSSLAG